MGRHREHVLFLNASRGMRLPKANALYAAKSATVLQLKSAISTDSDTTNHIKCMMSSFWYYHLFAVKLYDAPLNSVKLFLAKKAAKSW